MLDGVVERAIRAPRDEFERALLTEWDANQGRTAVTNAYFVQ
jgi:hypothetical protein